MVATLNRFIPPVTPRLFPVDSVRRARAGDAAAVEDLVGRWCVGAALGPEERVHVRRLAAERVRLARRALRGEGGCYVAESGGEVVAVCAWGPWVGDSDVEDPPRYGAGAAEGRAGRGARVGVLALEGGPAPSALARLLLILCETAAAREGFGSVDAVVTLPERWPFLAGDFRVVRTLHVRGDDGVPVPCLLLRKAIGPGAADAAVD